ALKWPRLRPYEKFAAMIDRHWDGIAAYCHPDNKVALGFVEGLNNKVRVLQRRAYGLRDEEYLRLHERRGAADRQGRAARVAHPQPPRTDARGLEAPLQLGRRDRQGPGGSQRPIGIEGRHGFAGAPPSVGGLGGPFEAPHVVSSRPASGETAPRRTTRWPAGRAPPSDRGGRGACGGSARPDPSRAPRRRRAGRRAAARAPPACPPAPRPACSERLRARGPPRAP
ncbi:MAG: transposase, partial [Candidatus Rokubacteria bacterium]|nr:transposase [Candidatus Rokubacteria bacterium]